MRQTLNKALIFLALACPHPSYASPCTPRHVADLPLHDNSLFLNTPVVLDGRQARFIPDTGSEGSLITPEAAIALRLNRDRAHSTIMQGPDGRAQLVPNLLVRGFALGPLPMGQRSLPLGALPGLPDIIPPIVGLLGVDLLGGYDLEFNVKQNRLTLWEASPKNSVICEAAPAWPHGYTTLPAKRNGTRLTVEFVLDGHTGTALVDSGARSHILSRGFARRMGLTDAILNADPGGITSGVDLNARRYHWHQFSALHLQEHIPASGNPVWKHPVLTISDLHDSADMLLGADWFTQHDIWISFSTSQIWVR